MRLSTILVCGAVLVTAGSMTTVSLTLGQDRPVVPSSLPVAKHPAQPVAQRPARDLSKWPFFSKQIYLSAQRGSAWLQRANLSDGRFKPGFVPALNSPLDSDSYLMQAGATAALGRAGKYFNDEQAIALARQAVLTLLMDTAPEDPKNPTVLVCTLPTSTVNSLAAAAAVVKAIHELNAPAAELLEPSDQLCNFIQKAQKPDGSLGVGQAGADIENADAYSGEALSALIFSHQTRPAPWKLEIVHKALPFYESRWKGHRNLLSIPAHTAAFAEAYLQTREQSYADFVFEMNDWLCTFQYQQLDPRHAHWLGGFMSCVDGKPVASSPPHVAAAAWAESLLDAARVARQAGDLPRWERYKSTLERSLQFLTTLQYTEANSQHFAEWYRPTVLGAFHASHADGNIRLDYTPQAVNAMVGYLTHVAEVPK